MAEGKGSPSGGESAVVRALDAANERRAQLQKVLYQSRAIDLGTLRDLQGSRASRPRGLNEQFTRSTIQSVEQANRYQETSRMWKARLQEREGGPETTKEQEAERERQEPALSQQGTSGSEPEAAPEEGWSLASFLATKVKRGRGEVGSCLDRDGAAEASARGELSDTSESESSSQREQKASMKRKHGSKSKSHDREKRKKHKKKHTHKSSHKKQRR